MKKHDASYLHYDLRLEWKATSASDLGLVEAAGVEPASETTVDEELSCFFLF